MNLDLRCATCKHNFEFSIEENIGEKEVICPNCERSMGTVEFEVNHKSRKRYNVAYAKEPMPEHTLTIRAFNKDAKAKETDINL
jgi:uncharacterized Zn finger protein (UPF0148 family)